MEAGKKWKRGHSALLFSKSWPKSIFLGCVIALKLWLSFTQPETNLIGRRCTTRKTGSSSPSWRPPQKLSLPTQSSALFLTVHLSLELEDLSVPGEYCPLDHATSPYSLSGTRHTYSSHVQYFYGRTADGRRTAEWASLQTTARRNEHSGGSIFVALVSPC